MTLAALRVVGAVDALNVAAVTAVSPRHGAAAAAGYAPALAATLLVHADGARRPLARALCVFGLLPNTAGALLAARSQPPDRRRRDRMLSAYVAVGGALLGVGYLVALRDR